MSRTSTRATLFADLSLGLALALLAGCGAARLASAGSRTPSSTKRSSQQPGRSPSASPGRSCGGAGRAGSAGSGGSSPQANLSGVQFVSASDGWVAGSDRILHTADGGRHWVIQYLTRPAAQLGTVDFVDSRHGWVTGTSEFLVTTDGGAHWRSLPEPCQVIRAAHFVNPDDGFAVAGGNQSYFGVSSPPLGGGVLMRTTDGGQHWQLVPTPPDVQTVCFTDPQRGWMGAGGSIYGTVDGGRTWTLAVRGRDTQRHDTFAEVECAGHGSGWAQVIGPGAALSHRPQIGYHTAGQTWQPIFTEQYTAPAGLRARVHADSPGVYPGPFSAISPDQAVFIGWCPPCSGPASPRLLGPAPMDIALHGGTVLLRRGRIARFSQAAGAAFVTASEGWVTGTRQARRVISVIMHTADGGRTWQTQYVLSPS
jgi:photosystem II stability/assembly factor-like uncharacterized protein